MENQKVVVIGGEPETESLAQKIEQESKVAEPVLSQAEKDEKFRQAFLALAKLDRLRKKKHRGQNPGAFGGAHPGIKKKRKLARYLSKNTIA